jgi:hypothetical protein
VTVEEVRHNIQKERRIIDTLEPVMNQHRLVVDRKLILADFESTKEMPTESGIKYQLFYQLTRIMKDSQKNIKQDKWIVGFICDPEISLRPLLVC